MAAHLAGRVCKCLVAVVERDLVHAASKRFDDFAVQHELLFLFCDGELPCEKLRGAPEGAPHDYTFVTTRTFCACGPLGPCSTSNSTCVPSASDLKPSPLT